MTALIALDTSVALPLLVTSHQAHLAVVDWWSGRDVTLAGPALAETYAILTRLPGDARLAPEAAARLLASRFAPTVVMSTETHRRLPAILAGYNISGGAVYDALVALAAQENDCVLATRDSRATATYGAVGVRVDIVGR